MKEVSIKIRIDEKGEGEIKVMATTKGFGKGVDKEINLAGIYSYLMQREISKIHVTTKCLDLEEL